MINNLNILLPEIFLTLSVFSILMIGVFLKESFNLIFNLSSLIIITIAIVFNSQNNEEKIFLEDEKNTKNTLSENVKIGIRKKIQKKKKEIKKLQELYAKPESIPGEVKTQVAKKIEQKKNELKELYSSPKDKTSLFKMKKWAAVQVAKVFLGIPVVPGR